MQQLDLAREDMQKKMMASFPPGTFVTFPFKCGDKIEVATIRSNPKEAARHIFVVDAAYHLRKLPNWSTVQSLYAELHKGSHDVKVEVLCPDRAFNALKRGTDVPSIEARPAAMPMGEPPMTPSQNKLLADVVASIKTSGEGKAREDSGVAPFAGELISSLSIATRSLIV
jgi:hypothetical protein